MTPSFPEYATIPSAEQSSGTNENEYRLINSRLFTFAIGETIDGSPTEFQVHEQVIARLSEPLHALTKGELSEAQAARTTWKDVSKETFERFVQFAYTGDYSIPDTREWDAKPQNEETDTAGFASLGTSTALEGGVEKEEGYDSLEELRNRKKINPKRAKGAAAAALASWGSFSEPVVAPEDDFPSLPYPLLEPRDIYRPSCEPSGAVFPRRLPTL